MSIAEHHAVSQINEGATHPVRQASLEFCMLSIREGRSDAYDVIVRTFRDPNSRAEQILDFLYRADEFGMCPLHWAAYNTFSTHDIVLALVEPIKDCPDLYDVLALRVVSPDSASLPEGVNHGMNMFQINIARGGTSAVDMAQKYAVQGLNDVFFNTPSDAHPYPELCLAAAVRLDSVKSVISACGPTIESQITLLNSSRTQDEGWTSLHMVVVHEVEKAKEIISHILSCFDDHDQEKIDFLKLFDKQDGFTALQSTALADSVEKTQAILSNVSVTDQQALLNQKTQDNRTFIHICAASNATKILADVKNRISAENWCDQILSTNSSDETALHVALNYGKETRTILMITEFLGSRRNAVLRKAAATTNPTSNCHSSVSKHLLKILIPTRHPNALHFASYVGDDLLVQYLLEEVSSKVIEDYVSQTNEEEENFLHVLSNSECGRGNGGNHNEHLHILSDKTSQSKTVRKLVTQKNKHGYTPSHNALRRGNIDYLLNFIRYMRDINDVKVILSQKSGDGSSLQELIPSENTSTQIKLEVLQKVIDTGIRETLSTFDLDLQKCIDSSIDIPGQVLHEHIENTPVDSDRLEHLFVQQRQLRCAALSMRVGNFQLAEESMEKAALGPDNLHIDSNLCRLKLQENDDIGALISAYNFMYKLEQPEQRLLAKSDFAYMCTKLGNYSNFERARDLFEEILHDEAFNDSSRFTKLTVLSSFAKILPRLAKRTKFSLEQKRSCWERADEILDQITELLADSDESVYHKIFCLIWKCDIATQKYDWSRQILDNLHEANELLEKTEPDYNLPARIAMVCNSVCYGAMLHFDWNELEEFHVLGTLCCNRAIEYGFTTTAGFTKVQLLCFHNLRYLYGQGASWKDFKYCPCHPKCPPNSEKEEKTRFTLDQVILPVSIQDLYISIPVTDLLYQYILDPLPKWSNDNKKSNMNLLNISDITIACVQVVSRELFSKKLTIYALNSNAAQKNGFSNQTSVFT